MRISKILREQVQVQVQIAESENTPNQSRMPSQSKLQRKSTAFESLPDTWCSPLACLGTHFLENGRSHTLAGKGSTEIRVSDWNFGALILPNIIHCRNYALSKTIDLETLAKTVLIADYYGCLHVFSVLADEWTDQLEHHFPQKYSRDLVLWLCIS